MPPDSHFFEFTPGFNNRRVGAQSALINGTLWLHGGAYIKQDGTVNTSVVPGTGKFDATLDFQIPSGPMFAWQATPEHVPIVAHGTMWSNLISRAWLFGGRIYNTSLSTNRIWRFEPESTGEKWTAVGSGAGKPIDLPSNAACCNVSDLERGYCLGGEIQSISEESTTHISYSHELYIFNTQNETLSTITVPDYVPVVNQSMVWLDTGNRNGVLAVLGGFTEVNGRLDMVPLTSIFIFDISSQTWMQQSVTGQTGHQEETDTVVVMEPSNYVPRKRYNACTVVGSAQDKTSHNIYLLGGENTTHTTPDVWVLSLPSAVWIKLPFPDGSISAKPDSSCIFLNSRYVLMFGGCYHEQNPDRPCMSYSNDPLNYDIALASWQPYSYQTNGYSVPVEISRVIGGDGAGNSPNRIPMFTNYSNPALAGILKPPHAQWSDISQGAIHVDPLARTLIPILLGCALVLAMLYYGVAAVKNSTRVKFETARLKKAWKPFVLRHSFLIFVFLQTTCLIALLTLLRERSQAPDPDPWHWTGGLDSAGTWTRERYTSRFIRAPGLERPRRGLISVYRDVGPAGLFNLKNFTQRFPLGTSWAFNYLPTLIAVLYGRVWVVLDEEIKRTNTYVVLRRGASGRESLCLDYHTFWMPLSIFQAVRYRHWAVAVSSTAAVVASIILPIVQSYVFRWDMYSGGTLAWNGTYSWGVALIDSYWAVVTIALLGLECACVIVLSFLLSSFDSRLTDEPLGIARVADMLLGQDAASLGFFDECDKSELHEVHGQLARRHFQLMNIPGVDGSVLKKVQPPSSLTIRDLYIQHLPHSIQKGLQAIRRLWGRLKRTTSPLKIILERHIENQPHGYIIMPWIFLLWLILLSALLVYGIYLAIIMDKNAKQDAYNMRIPLDPSIYLVIGIFVQSITDVVHQTIRILTPFHALRSGYQSPRILWTDYIRSVPFYELFLALKNNDILLFHVFLTTYAIMTYTVFLSALQTSSSSYGATSFASDRVAAQASTVLVSYVLVVNVVVGWRFCVRSGRGPVVKRFPETLGAVIPMLLFSPLLREDLVSVRGEASVAVKVKKLEGRVYGLGVFRDSLGKRRIGVERHYLSRLDGVSNIDLMARLDNGE